MIKLNFRRVPTLLSLGLLALALTFSTAVWAQPPAVDPAATQILKQMTDYVGSLKTFSLNTQNTIEDLLDSGHRIDSDVSAQVIISRPDKVRAERKGELIDQIFFYDGKTLTLYNPTDKVYATEPTPSTIEEMLDFARESLGLLIPAADLIYRNGYALLMQDVTMAQVVGKAVINGIRCNHLLFSRPGVDFQVWVADSGEPLPYKFVVTDTGTPARLSISTVTSKWNTKPSVSDKQFVFQPPKDAKLIQFMPLK